MSSLYYGEPGMGGLASMYPLYGITIPLVPLRCNKPPSGRILNPNSEQNSSVWADLGPSIHQCHHLHPLYHSHSLIGMAN